MNFKAKSGTITYTNKLRKGSNDGSNLPMKQYCRLCAQLLPVDTLVQIFAGKGTKYAQMLETCLTGKIKQNDGYPHTICSSCIKQLEECYKIISSFLLADHFVKQILNKAGSSNKINNSTPKSNVEDNSPNDLMTGVKNEETEADDSISFDDSLSLHSSIEIDEPVIIKNEDIKYPVSNKKPESSDVNKKQTVEPEETFEIKYQCIKCLKLFNTKEEVSDHLLATHAATENNQNGYRVVKAKLKVSKKSVNTENIPVEENKPAEIIENKFQCLQCKVLCNNKQEFLKHSTEKHRHNTRQLVCKLVKVKLIEPNPTIVQNENLLRPPQPIKVTTSKAPIIPATIRKTPPEPTVTYDLKYQCKTCSILCETYKEVLEHFEELHPPLKEPGPVALLAKMNNQNELINCVDDGTIVEIDPSIIQERRRLKYSEFSARTRVKPRFNCTTCPKSFSTKKVALNHANHCNDQSKVEIIVPKRKTSYQCLICRLNNFSKFSLIYHTRNVHPSISKNKFLSRFLDENQPKLECLHCNSSLEHYIEYKTHMSNHYSFICEECGMKCYTLNNLKFHIASHDAAKPVKENYKCTVCDEEFSNKTHLKKHKQTHIPKEVEEKKYERVCDVCGKTFDAKYIKKHQQTHNTGKPYKCKSCPKTFKTQHMLWFHQRTHNNAPSRIMCQVCGKVVRKSSLSLHMRTHSEEKPEVCDICGARFRRKDHLRNHLKTHQEDRSNPCPVCKIPLNGMQAYWSHVELMHGGKRPPPTQSNEKVCSCELCGKGFTSKVHLWQHKFSHMDYDLLPHKCELCDKKFRRAEHLRNHIRIHTGEKPFPCPTCQRPFRVRAEMVKHTRIHKRKEDKVEKKK